MDRSRSCRTQQLNRPTWLFPKSIVNKRTNPEIRSAEILAWRSGALAKVQSDFLAREEPLEIRVRGRSVAVTMRSPGHDRELAAGFLVTEGVVKNREDIIEIAPCRESDAPENTLNVFLAPGVELDFKQLTRHVFASSSCGLCGKASIEAVHQHFLPITGKVETMARILALLPDRMRAVQ